MGFHTVMLLTIDRAQVGMFAVVCPIWPHSNFHTAFEVLLIHQFVAVHLAAPFVTMMLTEATVAIAAVVAAFAVAIAFVAPKQSPDYRLGPLQMCHNVSKCP